MIVITGAYGFIGSALVTELNNLGYKREIIVVDDFYKDYKEANLKGKVVKDWVHRSLFLDWFERKGAQVEHVFHLGARTDTTSKDLEVFERLNLNYSKAIWNICVKNDIPLVYASSAATYGDGKHGFKDDHMITKDLKPLNPYGQSKLDFDSWVLTQEKTPSNWVGFRFFNVYGPNEYHKKRMASVVFHAYNQISKTGSMKLFRSHKSAYKDGMQKRDFVYVKDVLRIIVEAFHGNLKSGIYNLGTGEARTFNDLIKNVFDAIGKKQQLSYIDIPEDIRDSYQYFTEADMTKLKEQLPHFRFKSLEEGVSEYVQDYLATNKIY